MKIDTHVHTREGSKDGLISIHHTINILKEKGYEGMIVTDHNSYEGFQSLSKEDRDDFVVLKGIEYDTIDAGHMLVILPSGIDVNVFKYPGLKLKTTLDIVHKLGGIIGPAHPFDYSKLGIFNTPYWVKDFRLIREFDFIEGFNACGTELGNKKSKLVAKTLNKPMFGGSDSHKGVSVGKAHTILPERVESEDELIHLVKKMEYTSTEVSGEYHTGAMHNRLGAIYQFGLLMFSTYGKMKCKKTVKKAIESAVQHQLL